MPKLSEIELTDKVIEDEEYKKELKHLQKKLGELHNRLYRKRVPVIITYEGWDAAGKGGNIKRITEALDPRGFEVHPIASPEPHEKGASLPLALLDQIAQRRSHCHLRPHLVRPRNGRASGRILQ